MRGGAFFTGGIVMRIVEGITAKQEHVWIVIVSRVEGKEIEVGFRTRTDAVAYRNALLTLRRHPPAMDHHLEMVRHTQSRAAFTYGIDRAQEQQK
jgi:hypothetical protein